MRNRQGQVEDGDDGVDHLVPPSTGSEETITFWIIIVNIEISVNPPIAAPFLAAPAGADAQKTL